MNYFYRYLPLSPEMRAQSLYVLACGYTLIPPHSPYPPMRHPDDHHFRWNQGRTLQEYQIIYIMHGAGTFESETAGVRPIQAGTLFMLFPGEWHRYSPLEASGWDEYWIAFHGRRAEEFVAEYPLTPAQPVMEVGASEALLGELTHIMQEIRTEQIGYQKIIAASTLQILAGATAASLRHSFHGTETMQVVEAAKTLLRERVAAPVDIADLAAELGMGYCRFRRAFRQYTGLAPAQYHLQLRIHHASELLRTTTLTVDAVGQRSGFESDNYFFRIFKKKIGCTPGEYRARVQSGRSAALSPPTTLNPPLIPSLT